MRSRLAPVLPLLVVLCACGSSSESEDRPAASGTTQATPSEASSSPTAHSAAVAGRWQQRHSCQQLLDALAAYDLAALAPGVVGDFFPGSSPKELAAKGDQVCDGATPPQEHSHFFTDAGLFGSVDDNGGQVDDGSYEVLDDQLLRINEARFSYRLNGSTLVLRPLITKADRRRALANPLEFSTAGWQVAVSYDGLPWEKVPCDTWC